MNNSGFVLVIFLVFIIPIMVGGATLVFLFLWGKGRIIGKNMSITSVILLVAGVILLGVYEYLGVIDAFTFDYFLYFSWAAGAVLFLALISFSISPKKHAVFIHVINLLLFTFVVNKFIDPSIDRIKMSFTMRDSANNIAEFKLNEFLPQKLPDIERLFKSKSQQEKYELYSAAIYNKKLPKELYQFFVQQLGSPLKNRQGSFDYAAHHSDYYSIPFFDAIHEQNLTALQVFIDVIQSSSDDERKHAQDIVYAAPAKWTGLEDTFTRQINVFHDKRTQPDGVLKQAELLLSAFPGLAKTKNGAAIINSTIQNADVRAMKIFAKYSQPGSATLTAASYVLAGETDKLAAMLKTQPLLLRQQITIGKYYPASTNLLFYIVMFGNENIIQTILPMINWQDPELYYNEGNSYILAYAARRVKGGLHNASLETQEDAVDVFTLLLNTQLREREDILTRQLWEIATQDFYTDSWPNNGGNFDDKAIRSICYSSAGPQFLHYVDTLYEQGNNERVKSLAAGIKKACH